MLCRLRSWFDLHRRCLWLRRRLNKGLHRGFVCRLGHRRVVRRVRCAFGHFCHFCRFLGLIEGPRLPSLVRRRLVIDSLVVHSLVVHSLVVHSLVVHCLVVHCLVVGSLVRLCGNPRRRLWRGRHRSSIHLHCLHTIGLLSTVVLRRRLGLGLGLGRCLGRRFGRRFGSRVGRRLGHRLGYRLSALRRGRGQRDRARDSAHARRARRCRGDTRDRRHSGGIDRQTCRRRRRRRTSVVVVVAALGLLHGLKLFPAEHAHSAGLIWGSRHGRRQALDDDILVVSPILDLDGLAGAHDLPDALLCGRTADRRHLFRHCKCGLSSCERLLHCIVFVLLGGRWLAGCLGGSHRSVECGIVELAVLHGRSLELGCCCCHCLGSSDCRVDRVFVVFSIIIRGLHGRRRCIDLRLLRLRCDNLVDGRPVEAVLVVHGLNAFAGGFCRRQSRPKAPRRVLLNTTHLDPQAREPRSHGRRHGRHSLLHTGHSSAKGRGRDVAVEHRQVELPSFARTPTVRHGSIVELTWVYAAGRH